MWITPYHQDRDFSWPLTIDDKITIFITRTQGWQLDIAEQCVNQIPHSAFATLLIVLSYFEMIAKYQAGFTGEGKSAYYFKQGVYYVFPELRAKSTHEVDDLLGVLYAGARCGLYHAGMTDPRIIVMPSGGKPIVFNVEQSKLMLNPRLIVSVLKSNLTDYGNQLRDPHNISLRRAFEKRFDFDSSRP